MRHPLTVVLLLLAVLAMGQFPLVQRMDLRTGQLRPAATHVVQDGLGMLWTGSDMGVMLSDGERNELLLRTAPLHVNGLAAAPRGTLVSLSNGMLLRCTVLGCDTILHDTLQRSIRPVRLLSTTSGAVYMASAQHGLLRLEQGRWEPLAASAPVQAMHINDAVVLSDDRLAIATDQGLVVVRGGQVEQVLDQHHGLPDNLVTAVSADVQGAVWAGTASGDLLRWEPGSNAPTVLPLRADTAVTDLLLHADRMWCALANGVLLVHEVGRGGVYRVQEEQRSSIQLAPGGQGLVWWSNGTDVVSYGDPRVLHVASHEGIDLTAITALTADDAGRIWFATSAGLFHHPDAFTDDARCVRIPLALQPNTPLVSLTAATDHTVLAGSFGAGVWAIQADGRSERLSGDRAPQDPNVLSVATADGTLWMGTLGGVAALGGSRVQEHGGLGPGFIYHVLPIDGKRSLAATDGHGVIQVGEGRPEQLGTGGARTVYSLSRDPKGRIWAGGPATGLLGYDGTTWHTYGQELGLAEADVHALAPYLDRMLVFTSRGVLAFDPARNTWNDIGSRMGLSELRMELNTVAIDVHGSLWVACDQGLVRIVPDSTLLASTPAVQVRDVRLGSEHLPAAARFITAHDANTLTVRYAIPLPEGLASMQFAYRLVGLSDQVLITREREISFPALPPGTYRFEVRPVGVGGREDALWTGFDLVVRPPWWRLPWVMALGAVMAGLVTFLLLRARERRIRHRQQLEQDRVRFQLEALRSQVDPHFLFNSFNTLVQLIESAPEKAVEHVDELSTFFRNILAVRDKDLIPLGEELELLATYFGLEQRRFGAAIVLEVQVPDEDRSALVVPLTLQLLVENALKHNVATLQHPLCITVKVADGDLIVHNTLQPRLTPPRSTGFGLDSIRQRYAALSARAVHLERSERSFAVHVPLIPARS